jgi:hypothetical protein
LPDQNINPQNLMKSMKNINDEFDIVDFDPLVQNDNSDKAKQVRECRTQITTRSIRDIIETQQISLEQFDSSTQKVF